MFVRARDLPKEPTSHGVDFPALKQVLVPSGVIPRVMQFAVSTTPGPVDSSEFDVPGGHRHPDAWEWYFVLGGNATFYVGDEAYEVEAGDFIGVPPGEYHAHTIPEAVELELLYMILVTEDEEDDTASPS